MPQEWISIWVDIVEENNLRRTRLFFMCFKFMSVHQCCMNQLP